jgi:chromosome segregation ATPase
VTEQSERITQLETELEVARGSLKDAESSLRQAQLDAKTEMETTAMTHNKTVQHLETQICEQKDAFESKQSAFELDIQQGKDLLANAKNEIESLKKLLSESKSNSEAYSKELSKQQSKSQELELKIVNLEQYRRQNDDKLQGRRGLNAKASLLDSIFKYLTAFVRIGSR